MTAEFPLPDVRLAGKLKVASEREVLRSWAATYGGRP
jgi:hypothetical protein